MKTELTVEQSARLIELGVARSKASENTEVGAWADSGYGKPIFTLADILAMLPKELCERRDGIRWDCHLSMCGYNGTWGAMYRLDSGDDFLVVFESPDLIDTLYELLIWCINEKYIDL